MCIVIDMNTLPSLFKKTSLEHEEFKPVRDWILEGKGKVVFGGSTYIKELSRTSYLRIFRLLIDVRKAVVLPKGEVDNIEKEIIESREDDDFDDAHLMAIFIQSDCKLLCSKDARSYKYLKDSSMYPRGRRKPKIYSRRRNADLLTDRNIASICLPCIVLSKDEQVSVCSRIS
ncbi:hypothetical protein [Dethiobacter alkaliphilus]|uniref:hypothetical protein n=1 Tax=Dethiobacter alkaliphilus TaxID=427926 RepID=UPI002226E248|nr:hypothetical protein [Dethiobacter alkaliphilus]MCW3491544.1 hypothetical protein [Dethiobacter alkaliphilus]